MTEQSTTELRCDYCGQRGSYPTELEIRKTARGTTVIACVDTDACDARAEANEPEGDDD